MEESPSPLRMSAAGYLEAAIVLDRAADGVSGLDEFLEASGIQIEPVTPQQARIARQAYARYGRGSGHPASLNFGDCFSYALAKEKGLPLLYKGDDFVQTDLA